MSDTHRNHGARRSGVAALAAAMLLAASTRASAERYGPIEVRIEPVAYTNESAHGYVEVPVVIVNNSPDEHTVTLTMPDRTYGGGAALRSVTRSVTVGASATVRVSLLQPPLVTAGTGIGVQIDGSGGGQPLQFNRFEHMQNSGGYYSGYPSYPGATPGDRPGQALISPKLQPHRFSELRPGGNWLVQTERPVSTWSGRWLAYSSYDAVFVGGEEMTAMPAGPREALMRYAAAGGTLVVVGPWKLPPELDDVAIAGGGGRTACLGFGRVIQADSPDATVMSEVRREVSRTDEPWRHVLDAAEAEQRFPVKEDVRVPVRGLFALLLVFAILIGPVNLIVLSRMRRRIWMLWTVPAISLVFATGVFLYNAIEEGWTGQRRIQAITLLDQRAHRASTIGWMGFYSPLTPGGGLRFDDETEITPQVGRWDQRGRSCTVDWTTDQHLASGWVTARIPATFMVRRCATERQRVEFSVDASGVWSAVNGLTVDIDRLLFASPDGMIHEAAGLSAGARVTLRPMHRRVEHTRGDDRLRRVFASDWLDPNSSDGALAFTLTNPQKLLAPGDYVAIVRDTPFVAEGLAGAKRREAEQADNVIYGAFAVEAAP